jgi:hypothetical protein
MRPIDADNLIDDLKQSAYHHCNNSREISLMDRVIRIVIEQPTVSGDSEDADNV